MSVEIVDTDGRAAGCSAKVAGARLEPMRNGYKHSSCPGRRGEQEFSSRRIASCRDDESGRFEHHDYHVSG